MAARASFCLGSVNDPEIIRAFAECVLPDHDVISAGYVHPAEHGTFQKSHVVAALLAWSVCTPRYSPSTNVDSVEGIWIVYMPSSIC